MAMVRSIPVDCPGPHGLSYERIKRHSITMALVEDRRTVNKLHEDDIQRMALEELLPDDEDYWDNFGEGYREPPHDGRNSQKMPRSPWLNDSRQYSYEQKIRQAKTTPPTNLSLEVQDGPQITPLVPPGQVVAQLQFDSSDEVSDSCPSSSSSSFMSEAKTPSDPETLDKKLDDICMTEVDCGEDVLKTPDNVLNSTEGTIDHGFVDRNLPSTIRQSSSDPHSTASTQPSDKNDLVSLDSTTLPTTKNVYKMSNMALTKTEAQEIIEYLNAKFTEREMSAKVSTFLLHFYLSAQCFGL